MPFMKMQYKILAKIQNTKGAYLKEDPYSKAVAIKTKADSLAQEEFVVVAHPQNLELLPSEARKQALEMAMTDMVNYNRNEKSGASACVAAGFIDGMGKLQAASANLGINEAYVVIVDAEKVVSAERLNKSLHNAKNIYEAKRLLKTGRTVAAGNVYIEDNNGLKLSRLSRAVGSSQLLTHDTDHVPDINALAVTLAKGQKAFIVVVGQGLFEQQKNMSTDEKAQFIGQQVLLNQNNPGAAAQELVKKSLVREAHSNVSVAVVPVTAKKAVMAAVFTAENGSAAAKSCNEHYLPRLEKRINDKIFASKDDFIIDLRKRVKTMSKDDILNLFAEMKKKNGVFGFIHVQENALLDSVRLLFKRARNKDEKSFWHTATYMDAVKLLKEAYIKQGVDADDVRGQQLIDYKRGNLGFTSETSTRAVLNQLK